MPRYAQAAADAAVMPISPNAHKGLIALASAAIGVTLFSLIPNRAPQAQSTQPQIQIAVPRPTPTTLPPPPSAPERQPVVLSPRPPTIMVAPVLPVAHEPVLSPVAPVQNPHVQTRQAVNMRSAPDNLSPVVRIVPQGTVMTVFGRRDGWVQVGDSTPWGWVYSGLLSDAP
jgi:uncharacterized protein YgiM (DUF1202 family)